MAGSSSFDYRLTASKPMGPQYKFLPTRKLEIPMRTA
jgi:hypothetical protein